MDSRRIVSHPALPWLVVGVFAMSVAAALDEPPPAHVQSSASPTPCVVPPLSTDRELAEKCHAFRGPFEPACEPPPSELPRDVGCSERASNKCRELMLSRQHMACMIERARRHPVVVDDWGECERSLREREQLERELAYLTCRRSGD
jgi:hypothetical protein